MPVRATWFVSSVSGRFWSQTSFRPTSTQPWVVLPPETPAVPEYYDLNDYWPAESVQRRRALLNKQQIP
jgi:hypothetical protein